VVMPMNITEKRINELLKELNSFKERLEKLKKEISEKIEAEIREIDKIKTLIGKEERAEMYKKKDLASLAILLSNGEGTVDELIKVLEDFGFSLSSKDLKSGLSTLSRKKIVKSQKGKYKCVNLLSLINEISKSPIVKCLENIDSKKGREIVKLIFSEYCKTKKSFHIRTGFLEELKKYGFFYKLAEKYLKDVIIDMRNKGLIKTYIGPDGISIGKDSIVAVVEYIGE